MVSGVLKRNEIRPSHQTHQVTTRWVRKRPASKMTKPMNSWMGFRTFYKKLFPGMQQKEASSHLKALWDEDPFKAKWTIISSAYSKIRDAVSKRQAPLHIFLSIVCPPLGILAVEEYLSRLNWTRFIDEKGEIKFKQTSAPNLKQLPDLILNTTMTSKDVVQLCAEEGFILQEIADKIINLSAFNIFKGTSYDRQGLLAFSPMMNQKVKAKTTYSTTTYTQQGPIMQLDVFTPNTQALEYQQTDRIIDINNLGATTEFDIEQLYGADFFNSDISNIFDHQFADDIQDCSLNNCESLVSFVSNCFQDEQLLPEKISEYDMPGFSYQLFLNDLY